MSKVDQYRLTSGIDGFWRLYMNGVRVFDCHDDKLNRALDYFDGLENFENKLQAMVSMYEAELYDE